MTAYRHEERIDARSTDLWGHCRPSGVLGILQEAAVGAVGVLHVSLEEMLERYHMFWMLARIWYRLDRPLYLGDRVEVRTWHRGIRRASTYRDFDLLVDGRPVGEAVSLWVLADERTRRLGRGADIKEFQGTDGGPLCKERTLSKLVLPEGMAEAGHREFHYSDLDINGHVNNVKYADFVCDALELEKLGPGRFVSSLQIGYQAECRAGERVALLCGSSGSGRYVHGADGTGKTRFDAVLTLDTLDEERQNG